MNCRMSSGNAPRPGKNIRTLIPGSKARIPPQQSSSGVLSPGRRDATTTSRGVSVRELGHGYSGEPCHGIVKEGGGGGDKATGAPF